VELVQSRVITIAGELDLQLQMILRDGLSAHREERTNSRSAPGTVGSSGRQLSSWDRFSGFRSKGSFVGHGSRPEAAAREYRSRGEEVVLTVSPQGVESVTPCPGHGVSGMVVAGPARRISPTWWIGTALEGKGRVDRYGLVERSRTNAVD